jgi:hypothetical protein
LRKLYKSLPLLPFLGALLFGGSLVLQIDDPATNPEALSKHAVMVAHITACHSPEKTSVTASAEGIVDGAKKSLPLKVLPLAQPGTFAVAREWPEKGTWAVKMIASNPDYPNYSTSVVIPIRGQAPQFASVTKYAHPASEAEVAMALK